MRPSNPDRIRCPSLRPSPTTVRRCFSRASSSRQQTVPEPASHCTSRAEIVSLLRSLDSWLDFLNHRSSVAKPCRDYLLRLPAYRVTAFFHDFVLGKSQTRCYPKCDVAELGGSLYFVPAKHPCVVRAVEKLGSSTPPKTARRDVRTLHCLGPTGIWTSFSTFRMPLKRAGLLLSSARASLPRHIFSDWLLA